MAKHNILGKNGEKIAAEYLVKQGYDIRDINWRNGRYEIDIVATQGKYLVIVEVKTRQSDIFGLPEDAINDKKIRHLIDGGSVILRVNDNLSTLLDFRYRRKYQAAAGVSGQGRKMAGKRGENLIIEVPRGTVVRDAETNQIITALSNI